MHNDQAHPSLDPLAAARTRLEWLQKMGFTTFKSGPGGKWRGHHCRQRTVTNS